MFQPTEHRVLFDLRFWKFFFILTLFHWLQPFGFLNKIFIPKYLVLTPWTVKLFIHLSCSPSFFSLSIVQALYYAALSNLPFMAYLGTWRILLTLVFLVCIAISKTFRVSVMTSSNIITNPNQLRCLACPSIILKPGIGMCENTEVCFCYQLIYHEIYHSLLSFLVPATSYAKEVSRKWWNRVNYQMLGCERHVPIWKCWFLKYCWKFQVSYLCRLWNRPYWLALSWNKNQLCCRSKSKTFFMNIACTS